MNPFGFCGYMLGWNICVTAFGTLLGGGDVALSLLPLVGSVFFFVPLYNAAVKRIT